MGLALYSAAATTATFLQFIPQTYSYVNAGPFEEVKDCLDSQCPEIDKKLLFPRVAQAFEEFSRDNATFWERYVDGFKLNPEYLRFDTNDLRPKGLVITAHYEQNGVLNPRFIAPLVNELSKELDDKFVVARTVQNLCKYIEEAGKLANDANSNQLKRVVIFAQGNSENVAIEEAGTEKGTLNAQTNFESCFDGLDPSGRIILLSSKTGESGSSIAQKMATKAKREVVAPVEEFYPSKLSVSYSDKLQAFHPSQASVFQNIFKLFRPVYEKCTQVYENIIHPKERSAVDAIKENLAKKGLISKTAAFEETQEYLRLCPSDPKKKILFLIAEKGQLDPELNGELLGSLADHYDTQVKVVSEYEQICREIQQAATKTKNLEYVILNIEGNEKGLHIAGPAEEKIKNWISPYTQDIKECFSGLNEKGKIVLLSGPAAQIGKHGLKDNIAGFLAAQSNKTVLAADEPVQNGKTEIASIDPLELYHPSKQPLQANQQKPGNVFKEIKP